MRDKINCRPGCAACCIVISISSPLPGMPDGKPAGVRCPHLDDKNCCTIHGTEDYPEVCREFSATREMCGSTNSEAYAYLAYLENATT